MERLGGRWGRSMCGFAGVFCATSSGSCRMHEATLAVMADRLGHRGPDARGVYCSDECGLVHTRLSVIDLTPAGRQPMANEDRTVFVAFNGEIYNYRELRRRYQLDERGHRFRSGADTEVLLHLYEELGADFTSRLDGMFAIAIWDARKRTLLLARDRWGVKPLFYTFVFGNLWFASEIKALLAIPGVRRQPSLAALHHFLSFDYIPGTLTAFEGIHEVAPGAQMLAAFDPPSICHSRYCEPWEETDETLTMQRATAEAEALLKQAVSRQLVSDVPVGVMLSGGLDSSAIAAFAAQVVPAEQLHTFAVTFDEPSFDESRYSRLMARHLGTVHHEVKVTSEDVSRHFLDVIAHIDEPYADGAAIPTFMLAQVARRDVTVLLSGEGGDELYAGYDTYLAYKVRRWYRRLPAPIRGIVRRMVKALPVSYRKLSWEFKAKRFTHGAEASVAESHFRWRMVLDEDAKQILLTNRERYCGMPSSASLFTDFFCGCPVGDDLDRLQYLDAAFHLADDLMVKNDRMTMAWSIEARVPFLDLDHARFLRRVPSRLRMPGLSRKKILKSALARYVPREVLCKKKVGLELPYSGWLRTDLRPIAEELLGASKLRSTGLFDVTGVRQLWDQHQRGWADHGRLIWGLLTYMAWHDMYITSDSFLRHMVVPRQPRSCTHQ
jgi:asparagine synthase (glutamine-hydrolysing)